MFTTVSKRTAFLDMSLLSWMETGAGHSAGASVGWKAINVAETQ
jgi:hypothetical protein